MLKSVALIGKPSVLGMILTASELLNPELQGVFDDDADGDNQ